MLVSSSPRRMAALAALLALGLEVYPAPPILGPGHRKVLVLYSYSRFVPWEGRVLAGLDEALSAVDIADRPYVFEESLDASRLGDTLDAAASVPVFSHFDSLLGTGIVGGYLVSGARLGRIMADVAARGEAATPPAQDSYQAATMGYFFDARALARWGIDEKSLPEGSVLINEGRGALERYWKVAVAAALAFLLETALVASLARLTRQRKRALALLAQERAGLEAKVAGRTAELAKANEVLNLEVAERRKSEERERAAAQEKALLLKELQHRVKNSLGIIAGIAGLEAEKAKSAEGREALVKLESRVVAVGALYDILYATGGVGEVEARDYLGLVVDSAMEGLGAEDRGIVAELRVESNAIDLKRAVSLGLVVNELVTDCVKHAYPGGGPGRISVSLLPEGPDLVLRVEDDGVGLPPGFEPGGSEGFGLALAITLAEQLKGRFAASSGGLPGPRGRGARFELRMPLQPRPAATA